MAMFRWVGLLFVLFAATAASAQTQVPADSRLKTITATKTVRIAYRTDATPFAFKNDKGDPSGYSLDLCGFVVKSMAQQLGVADLKIQWVPVTVQTRFSAVSGGSADMECGSSTVTLGRMKEVDFSNFIFVESTGVVTANAANAHSLADLAGKKIAVITGTTNERAIREQIAAHGVAATIVSVKDSDEGVAALETGKVDAYASDKLLLMGAKFKNPDAFAMLPDDLSVEAYAIALPRGDWALRLAVNTGLAQVYRSGQIVRIFNHWFAPIGLHPGPTLIAVFALGALSD